MQIDLIGEALKFEHEFGDYTWGSWQLLADALRSVADFLLLHLVLSVAQPSLRSGVTISTKPAADEETLLRSKRIFGVHPPYTFLLHNPFFGFSAFWVFFFSFSQSPPAII